ncbi:MAG TPA: PilZ domain-containing protein [Tepidisphaeraceae bacterium]|nr:PilZ domain-containing protein [Tepidisphaeraceae bacterium]
MLSIGLQCLILLPNEQNKRLLIPAKVLDIYGDDAVVELEEPVVLKPGTQSNVFAEWLGRFFQQGITIVADDDANSEQASCMVRFTSFGEPVSAESRGSYRVSIAAQRVYARIGLQERCHVVDVSAEGFAVVCKRPLTVGEMVEVSLSHEGVHIAAAMKVQGVNELSNGTLRFGLFAPEKKSPARAGLQKLSLIMQRQQLKRFAGAA